MLISLFPVIYLELPITRTFFDSLEGLSYQESSLFSPAKKSCKKTKEITCDVDLDYKTLLEARDRSVKNATQAM